MSESYEVEYYIDHYLKTRNFVISNKNRDIIGDALEKYPGRAPFKRTALDTYLDGRFKKN